MSSRYSTTSPTKLFEMLRAGKYKPLPKDEEYKLLIEFSKTRSRAIRDKLVNSNVRFVVSLASKSFRCGDFDDLVQEGIIGLMTAVDRYDISYKVRLCTYATQWILVFMRRYTDSIRFVVHIPKSHRFVSLMSNIGEATSRIYKKYGQIDNDKLREMLAEDFKVSVADIESIQSMDLQAISFDAPVASRLDSSSPGAVLDTISAGCDTSAMYEQAESEVTMSKMIETAAKDIDAPIKRTILKERLLAKDGEARTLDSIATEYSVSREMVRLRQMSLLAELKNKLSDPWMEYTRSNMEL